MSLPRLRPDIEPDAPIRRDRPLLGTFVEITADTAETVEAGFAAITTVHRLMSAHEPDSELSRLNREGFHRPVPLHPWTAEVLARALFWAEASRGRFDPTVGGRIQAAGLIPLHPGQPPPSPQADWRDVALAGHTAWLRRACVLDLGGIAKGFAVDQAVAAMVAAGAERGLVNAGGDLRGFGPAAWPVTVVEPLARQPAIGVSIRNGAAATSAVRPGRGGGRHLPGRGRLWTSATVTAPTAMDADALTKIVLIGGRRVPACLRMVEARAYRLRASGWEMLA